MLKIRIFILVCLQISLSAMIFLPTANAVSCKEVKASVLSEENYGFEVWKKFDDFRKVMPKELRVGHLRTYVRLMKPVHSSDQRVFALILSNPSCFNATVLKDAKSEAAETKDNANALVEMLAEFKSDSESTKLTNTAKLWTVLHDYYAEFWEIVANKRMSAPAKLSTTTKSPAPSASKSSSSLGNGLSAKV